MGKTTNVCSQNRSTESCLIQGMPTHMASCDEMMLTRGHNIGREPVKSCVKPVIDSYRLQNWLLVPCLETTHKNYLKCDDNKCCSIKHQMFKNQTRRKDLTFFS